MCLTLRDPMDCSWPGSSVHGILQARVLKSVAISSSRGSSQPRDQNLSLLHFLHWQVNSLPFSHWGSSKDAGMGSYSLLQGIFPTQESNPGLLHCRQILYCLSHQGIPRILELGCYFRLQVNFLIQGTNPHLLPWQVQWCSVYAKLD